MATNISEWTLTNARQEAEQARIRYETAMERFRIRGGSRAGVRRAAEDLEFWTDKTAFLVNAK
jgi:hypothetical protein